MDAELVLPGSWQLVSWTLLDDRGVNHPFGADATGQLMYTGDGAMSAIVMAAARPALPGQKPRDASDAELATAFLSFFCYAGRWHVEGEVVVHTVELAVNPNNIASEQRRRMTFSEPGVDGRATVLELSADEATGRGQRHHRLTWRRG